MWRKRKDSLIQVFSKVRAVRKVMREKIGEGLGIFLLSSTALLSYSVHLEQARERTLDGG